MNRILAGAAGALVGAAALVTAQPADQPFKLGTFAQGSRTFAGLVLRDAFVVDIAAAQAALGQGPAIPSDLRAIVAQYDAGVSDRLKAIARDAAGRLQANRPAYIHELASLDTRAPFEPTTFLNVAVNYLEHANEMSVQGAAGAAKAPPSIAGIWARAAGDTRHNPYIFMKPPVSTIGDGEPIRIPTGRTNIDYECEFTVVVGKAARRVPVERAREYIFGYAAVNDVSDRAGRGDGRHGSDWFIGKGHDTFGPFGPFVVPAEFVGDPQKLAIKFTLSSKVMQDSSTSEMIHNVYEILHYASNMMTLRPGDIIATGSPSGVGVARKPPVFMKPGDVAACTIERIGTLTNPVVAEGAGTSSNGR